MKKFSKLLVAALCLALVVVSASLVASATATENPTAPITFTGTDYLKTTDPYPILPRTIEARILVAEDATVSGPYYETIVGTYKNKNNTTLDLQLRQDTGGKIYPYLYYHIPNGTTTPEEHRLAFSSCPDLRTGEVTDIAVTIDAANSAVKLYVNGTLTQTLTDVENFENLVSSNQSLSNPFGFGHDNTTGANSCLTCATLYGVTMYSDIRTAAEVASDCTAPAYNDDNILGSWDFSSAGPVARIDRSAKKNDLTIVGFSDWGKSFATYDRYQTPVLSEKVMTFEAWVNFPADCTTRGIIFSSYRNTGSILSLSLEVTAEGYPRFFTSQPSNDLKFTSVNLFNGEWTHLAFTVDSTNVYCYINGVKIEQTIALDDSTLGLPEYPFIVGNDIRNSYPCLGQIYSVAVYSDLRTDDEIRSDLYAPDTDGLMGLWYPGEKGEAALEDHSGNDNDLYAGEVTDYGIIPQIYDATTYPFVVFDENKNFIGAYQYFYGDKGGSTNNAMNAAKNVIKGNVYDATSNGGAGAFTDSSRKSYLLMRRDYTLKSTAAGDAIDEYWNNLAQFNGECTIDLGGYTLSQSACAPTTTSGISDALFSAQSKAWTDATVGGDQVFPSTLNIKNGTLAVYRTAVIYYAASSSSSTAHKVFTFNFDDVTFKLAADIIVNEETVTATTSSLLLMQGTRTQYSGLNINVSDSCVFDLATVAPSSAITIFDATGNYVKISVSINIGAVEIRANDFTNITVASGPKPYTDLYIAEGAKIKAPTAADPYTASTSTTDGSVYFFETGTEGANTIYTARQETVTAYGTIPGLYDDATTYPFIVFTSDGKVQGYPAFIGPGGEGSTDGALYVAKTYVSSNVYDMPTGKWTKSSYNATILMRRDYTFKLMANGDAYDEYFNNLPQVRGVLTIDLGGFTLTKTIGNSNAIFGATSKAWSHKIIDGVDYAYFFPSTYNIKNGTVRAGASAIVAYGQNTTSDYDMTYAYRKIFTFNFDNVTFALSEGATTANLLVSYATNKMVVPGGLVINVADNCVFDLASVEPTSAITLINASKTGTGVNAPSEDFHAEINVGAATIRVDDEDVLNDYIRIATTPTAPYTELHLNGTKIVLPAGVSPYGKTFTSSDGSLTFFTCGKEGEKLIYEICTAQVTPYGTIPADYADAETYPFAVFRSNGTFHAACTTYGNDGGDNTLSALNRARNISGIYSGSVILLRRDYTYDGAYNNLSMSSEGVTFDLGGYTFTAVTCPFGAQKKTENNTGITVKNGTFLLTGGYSLVRSGSTYRETPLDYDGYGFSLVFEDLTIRLDSSATTSTVLVMMSNGGNSAYGNLRPSFSNITFKNCDIDVSAKTSKLTLVSTSDGTDMTTAKVEIDGGTIKASDFSKLTYFVQDDVLNSTFKFGTDDEGNYPTLLLPSAATAPSATQVYDAASSKTVYHTTGETADSITAYPLVEPGMRITGVKQNIELATDFYTKVYFPITDDYEITGIQYKIGNGSLTTIPYEDGIQAGKSYRFVRINSIPAYDASKSIKLYVTFTYGGKSYTQITTTSVAAYAKALKKAYVTGAVADLADAMLRYAKSACVLKYGAYAAGALYGADVDRPEGLGDMVDAVENTSSKNYVTAIAPVIDGSQPYYQLTLNKDTIPAGTFKISYTSNKTGETVSFERSVLAGDGTLSLQGIKLYDLAETLTISFSTDGENYTTEIDAYNLAAYYDSLAAGDAKDVVAALYDYAVASRIYKFGE